MRHARIKSLPQIYLSNHRYSSLNTRPGWHRRVCFCSSLTSQFTIPQIEAWRTIKIKFKNISTTFSGLCYKFCKMRENIPQCLCENVGRCETCVGKNMNIYTFGLRNSIRQSGKTLSPPNTIWGTLDKGFLLLGSSNILVTSYLSEKSERIKTT